MPRILDAHAAAQEIRGRMEQPSADHRHMEAFVGQVLDQLGLEHTISNASMVVHALHDADIQPHQYKEYPKAVEIKTTNKDGKEVKKTVIVDDEDEEHAALHPGEDHDEAHHDDGGEFGADEYPKTIRGKDGKDHVVRDLKEEREFLGVGDSAIDPEASTQFKKAGLEEPTQEELDRAKATEGGGAMQKEALEQANKPKPPAAAAKLPSRPNFK